MQSSQTSFQVLNEYTSTSASNQIRELKKQNKRLKQKLAFREIQIKALKDEPNPKQQQLLSVNRQTRKLSQSSMALSIKIIELTEKLEICKSNLQAYENKLQDNDIKIAELEIQLERLDSKFKKKVNQNKCLTENNEKYQKTIEDLTLKIASLQKQHQQKKAKTFNQVKKYQQHITALTNEKVNLEVSLSELKAKIKVNNKHKKFQSEILDNTGESFINNQ